MTNRPRGRPDKVAPRRSVKISIKRQVWENAKSTCENCGSHYALQIEHIFPKALGGTDDLENLKLLCRSCNQRTAIEVYGSGKMGGYLMPAQ